MILNELPGNHEIFENQTLTLEEVQRKHILTTLKMTKWCIRGDKGAARILDLKPTTLESKMIKLGIERPKRKS